jgi:hypothetical protein
MPTVNERKPIALKHRAREAYQYPLNSELEPQPGASWSRKRPEARLLLMLTGKAPQKSSLSPTTLKPSK